MNTWKLIGIGWVIWFSCLLVLLLPNFVWWHSTPVFVADIVGNGVAVLFFIAGLVQSARGRF